MVGIAILSLEFLIDIYPVEYVKFIRYSQAGTPSLKVTSSYDAEAHTFSLRFR